MSAAVCLVFSDADELPDGWRVFVQADGRWLCQGGDGDGMLLGERAARRWLGLPDRAAAIGSTCADVMSEDTEPF